MKQNHDHYVTKTRTPRHNGQHSKTDTASASRRVEVEFTCEAPQAETVYVAGDFNHWGAGNHRLSRDHSGIWKTRVQLKPGRYEYRFIVDGEWRDDPQASTRVPNEFGSNNCVLDLHPKH